MEKSELLKYYERQFGPFTHMGPGDKAIWLRYLMAGGASFAPFTYDMRVGNGTTMPHGSSSYAISAAYALTTKRIDVVATVDGVTRIIEIKQRAGLGAVGQLIGYRQLFLADNTPPGLVEMWLITDQLQPDMIHILIENNIHCVEVGL